MRDQPDKITGIALAFLLIFACSWLAFHTLLVGLAACVVACGMIKEYIAPLRFDLSDSGASVRCAGIVWIEMPWEQVRSVYRTPAGLKLSPFANPSRARTEQLRGLTLRFPRVRAAEIERYVAEQVEAARTRNEAAA